MTVSEAIRKRRSIRKFKPGLRIPEEHIHLLLEAAMMAPSAGNTRPWEFAVVENKRIREQITQVHPYCQFLPEASLAIAVSGRPELQAGKMNGFWPQDCGAAIENLLLQAVELGYGACWCGVYPVEERAEAIRQILNTEGVPLAIVAVGAPDEAPKARGFFESEKIRRLP